MNKTINCIKCCGFHELPLIGHDEVEGSANRGVFLDLVTYTADLDGAFRNHLEKYNMAKNTLKSIQNDLLPCMLKVCTEEITREIKNSSYVSVQADETTDISCKSQFVIIVRCVKDFKPVERFLKFVELQDRTANGLTQALKENLDSLNLESKLIAPAYDGAAVIRGSINGVQVQMKNFSHTLVTFSATAYDGAAVMRGSINGVQVQMKSFSHTLVTFSATLTN